MKKVITVLAVAVVAASIAAPAWSDDTTSAGKVTFTRDVLPILQENCQTCHRPSGTNLSGMIAPMSLMTYNEVRPWSRSISRVVESKQMPPWHAHERFNGTFANERTLTNAEIATLITWAKQGSVRGRANDAPVPAEFPETGWNFGTPDIIVEFPEPFFVEDGVEDLYHDVFTKITEEQLASDRWISGIEFKPDSAVVHHIIGHAYAPGTGQGEDRGMLGGNAPGADQTVYPEGFGIKLHKGSTIRFAMHYHKESGAGTGTWDSSRIGIQLHDKDSPVTHPVEVSTIGHGAFEIPPGAGKWRVGASRTFKEDTLLLNMLPHMHLRGAYARYTAFYPDGTSEELLEVPEYDFNWQTGYGYKVMKELPAGTRIEMDLAFDNSRENADANGFNSERAIRFGGPTTDEMDLAWITIAPKAPVELSAAPATTTTGD